MCTSVPGSAVPDVRIPNVDKLVHFLLYGVLGLLLGRALKRHAELRPGTRRPTFDMLLVSIVTVAMFAAVDEWHQRWVPGRSSDVADWYADVAGGTSALLLAARSGRRRHHST